ncbi:MAG: YrdB family protein [Herpetosiphonaceae bacterium]|nr:YrdB family protein [Herpetosiphonaceae bacterium]
MAILKFLNAGLSFMLELCMLAALGYWGFHGDKSLIIKCLLGLGAPLAVAVIWGLFLAPQATHRLDQRPGTALALVLFGLAALALSRTGYSRLAITFGAVVVVNELLLLAWQQW